jgi:serine-type D-Ala-D-Ala carboxypeptidase/endopeptidase (penicillin-binding protein 4)
MHYLTVFFVSVLFLIGEPSSAISSSRPFQSDSGAIHQLQQSLNRLQTSPLVRNGTVALSVRRAKDGQPLLDYNAHLSLPPASTLKLVTTATALTVLGTNYTYQTHLEYDGTLRDSVLTGNLYIRGTGDPSLGSSRFAEFSDAPTLLRTWLDVVRQAGIKRIEGAIVGDATAIQTLPVPDNWIWGDMGNYYGAGLSGLNFNENLYRVVFQPAKAIGQPAPVLRTEPATPYLRFLNRVTTGAAGSGDEVVIYNAPYSNQVFLEGTVPTGVASFGVKGSLPDPAFSAAFALHEYLTKAGISIPNAPLSYGPGSITGSEPVAKPPKRTILHLHSSPLLGELAQQTNHQSINLYAEALLISAGSGLAKKPVTTAEAVKKVGQFWQAKGVELDGFRMKDGSGLSPSGSLTTANLTGILAAITREKSFAAFYESIPVVGESGTVRSLARRTAAAGNVRAKSGTIEGVRSYAGYVTGADGELLAFSLIVNKYQPGMLSSVMKHLEQIMVQMTALNGNGSNP